MHLGGTTKLPFLSRIVYNLASSREPRRDRMAGWMVGWLDGRTKESYQRGGN